LPEEPLLDAGFRERDERDLAAFVELAPLLELRALLLGVDFDLAFDVFDFDDDFARLGADRFFVLGFVWAIVPLLAAVPWIGP
jgi:hypothetical protein